MAGIDTRDPHLTRMRDGKVVMTFFAQGKVYYSYWQAPWTRFTDPVELRVTGMPSPASSRSVTPSWPASGPRPSWPAAASCSTTRFLTVRASSPDYAKLQIVRSRRAGF
ncbi:hypothetical protein AB0C12_13450 [Actinoplanes sp. NPDC048967]|uniref:hypothetical protein n=1 Tax=Actinoplanes sp. NPDC048967 TaxID=3155269 RepID=UPI0033FF22E8